MAAGAGKEEEEEDRSTLHAQDSPASCVRRLPQASAFDACSWRVPCSLPRILDAHGPLHLYATGAEGPESTPALIDPRNNLLSPRSCFQNSGHTVGEGREHSKEKEENVEMIAKRSSRDQFLTAPFNILDEKENNLDRSRRSEV